MKKIIFTLLAGLVSAFAFGQDITGDWNGVLKVQGIQLSLVLHIQKNGEGFSATLDSPDQKVKGIPVTSVTFANSVLKILVPTIGAEYEGKWGENQIITGDFKQMGQSFPLNFSKEKVEKEKIVRPQEPVKPYPYYEEEVFFENPAATGVRLAGTLTLPQKEGFFPAVVLITGSGAQNRDEELMGHKPFLVIADFLTRNGIAVLRFDDRGTAASTGDFKSATTYDFSTDAEAAVKYLQARKEINRKKIGLIGHSEGGAVAPLLAARSKEVAFVVLLAGIGIPGDQLLLLQKELIERASGVSEVDIQKGLAINKGAFEMVKKSTGQEQLKTDLNKYFEQIAQEIPKSGLPEGTNKSDFIKPMIENITSAGLQYLIKYDPAPALQKVKCPVLALNGSKDLQVPAKENLEAIKNALNKGGNKQVTTLELPGLNHLFQECQTGLPGEYATIEQTFSPKAMDEILKWIKTTTK
jgi:pimeloyl-ACP methyl ester carboxylesterase